MTNNGLERSNGLFKQNYSCGKRLSIPNHMTKICQFLKEQKDMKAQDEKFISKKQMEDAERFLNTNSEIDRLNWIVRHLHLHVHHILVRVSRLYMTPQNKNYSEVRNT